MNYWLCNTLFLRFINHTYVMEQMYVSVLLLTSLITSQADACIVGIIGESVHLPCIYNGVKNLTSLLISSEWRRNMEVIHTSDWMEEQVDMQNVSHSIRTTVSSSAPNTGDFTLELRDINLSDAHNYSFYLKLHGQVNSSLVCSVCLTVAGHFSRPTLIIKNIASTDETHLVCNTRGGFPAPNIYWLLNYTHHPPETTFTTYVHTHPRSQLYNITSVLSVSISPDSAVSCIIENYVLNETLTATNYCGFQKSRAENGRLSQFLWMFTTFLCVVVFILVALALALQMKLDRDRRRYHRRGDDSSSDETEMIVMDMEHWASLPETDV